MFAGRWMSWELSLPIFWFPKWIFLTKMHTVVLFFIIFMKPKRLEWNFGIRGTYVKEIVMSHKQRPCERNEFFISYHIVFCLCYSHGFILYVLSCTVRIPPSASENLLSALETCSGFKCFRSRSDFWSDFPLLLLGKDGRELKTFAFSFGIAVLHVKEISTVSMTA